MLLIKTLLTAKQPLIKKKLHIAHFSNIPVLLTGLWEGVEVG